MSDHNATYSRHYTYGDPMAGAKAAPDLSGLEYMQAIRDNVYPAPPIARTLDFSLDEVEEGKAIFSGEPDAFLMNPIGVVHGGYAATLLDSAMACAVHSTLPKGVAYTTVDLNIKLIRPLMPGMGRVQCIGEVIHTGRRIASATGRLVDANGKLYAHATTTCMVFNTP